MTPQRNERFPPEIEIELGFYVYRLIDPRNGETFYVGKGRGNRVFNHIAAEKSLDGEELDNKLRRIREIHRVGLNVLHIIHRHGMDEKTALHVEAALIDAYPGLMNVAGGTGGDLGSMHAMEIIQRYQAQVARFQHRVLLISINRTAVDRSYYDAVRYAWKLDVRKARSAEVVLAVVQGLIVEAFVATEWREAKPEHFPEFEDGVPGRFGFLGKVAPESLRALYCGKLVPARFRKPGAANPIKYSWK